MEEILLGDKSIKGKKGIKSDNILELLKSGDVFNFENADWTSKKLGKKIDAIEKNARAEELQRILDIPKLSDIYFTI